MNLLSVVFLLLSFVAAGTQGDSPAMSQWMVFYYKKPLPKNFVTEVRGMSQKGQLADLTRAGVIPAFLSQVFAQNPKEIAAWMNALKDLPEPDRYTLYNSLWLSNTAEGRDYLNKIGLQLPTSAAPDVLKMEFNDPRVVDWLWGYFMATGDERSVRRVISAFNLSKYEGAVERYKSAKNSEQSRQEAYYAISFEAARESLIDNCRQHPQVLAVCEKLIKSTELNKTESLWLGVVLSKVAPDRYKIQIGK